MFTRSDVERAAGATGFRPEVVEKAARLLAILERLDRHETTTGALALKGGTALNLFHLPLPRLSVDVDLNFVGAAGLEEMRAMRPGLERALVDVCRREECLVQRAPGEHAGGKFRLRFPSALGGLQNLEVDVSYVARVPLMPLERRRIVTGAFGRGGEFPTYTLQELAAGKFAALVTRTAARDGYDAVRLLEADPGLLGRLGFRLAFVCQLAAGRKDFLEAAPEIRLPGTLDVRQKLLPLLRVVAEAAAADPARLASELRERLAPAVRDLLSWTAGERRFLTRLTLEGELEPEHLTDDVALQERVRAQPMLLWKRRHVRRHRGLDADPADAPEV